jgi:hypothetical protein
MDLERLLDTGCVTTGELRHALQAPDPKAALADIVDTGSLRYSSHIALARLDPAIFCSFVLRDDETGSTVEMAPYHDEWHALLQLHPRLVLWSHYEAGKTTEISIGYVLWALGAKPNTRVVIVSATGDAKGTAAKISASIQKYIEESFELHAVFPDLVPGDRWRGLAFDVKRDSRAKDFSVQSVGVHGSIIGTRIDLLVFDDILTYENTRTAARRDDVIAWIRSSLLTRVTRLGRIVMVGNTWHPDDAMFWAAKKRGWHSKTYPVRSKDGVKAWPDKWPDERIAEMEEELGPLEAGRMLYCQPRSDDARRFKEAWIEKSLENGRGLALRTDCTPAKPFEIPLGCRTFTGVDLGVGKKQSSARTVLFTLLRGSDRSNTVLNVRSGKWHAEEIMQNAFDEQKRFNSTLIVESNAAQRFMVRFMQVFSVDGAPIIPFNTGRNKHHPQYGVEGLGIDMAQGLWCVPCADNRDHATHPEITAWLEDMRFYDPAGHTGDHLMASWMASEGACGRVKRHRVAMIDAADIHKPRPTAVFRTEAPRADRLQEMLETQKRQLWEGLSSLIDLEP